MQELAISAVGVDDHSKRHFTGMQCRAVQCSAFFPAPPPGLSVLRYIQPTTFHPKMCPREEILCAQNVLCRVIKFKRNVQQLKLDQTSFNQSFSKIKSLVVISVSSQVHHSDKILYSVLAFKFNAIQSKALAVQQKYIAFSELQCSIECYGIVLCCLFQLLDEKDCTKVHLKCSVV